MEVYIVANIVNINKDIIGYRLLDLDRYETKDVTKEQLKTVMEYADFKVENAQLLNNNIEGIYYNLNLLPKHESSLINKIEFSKFSYESKTIIKQNSINNITEEYIISDSIGGIEIIKHDQLKDFLRINKVNNAKLDLNGNIIIKSNKNNKVVEIISDEEARNKDIIWDISRFAQYMTQKKYKFTIRDSWSNDEICVNENFKYNEDKKYELSDIDENCKILHIPYGITFLKNLYDYNNIINIDTLIIPETVTEIDNLIKNMDNIVKTESTKHAIKESEVRLINIDYMWFQGVWGKSYNPSLLGLNHINILKDYNIIKLNNEEQLFQAFINCSLPKFPEFSKNISLSDCFINCIIEDSTLNLEGLKYINNCFNNIKNISTLNIGSTIIGLTSSFNSNIRKGSEYECMNINNIIVDNAKNLKDIAYSFSNINMNNYELDISNTNIEKIKQSFYNIRGLLNVKFNASIKGILADSFYGCNDLKEVTIPKDISVISFSAFSDNTKINFEHGFTNKITPKLYDYSVKRTLYIDDVFEIIAAAAFKNRRFDRIKNGKNIREIGYAAFRGSTISEIDFRQFPLVSEIKEYTFSECEYLKSVIISNNIKSIETCAFEKCSKLNKILISDSVENIGNKILFNSAESCGGTVTLYTVKGSEAYKKLKSRKNVNVLAFDNFDEALQAFNGEQVSENQKQKFKLISSGSSEYDFLKKEPFINYFTGLMKLYKLSKEKVSAYTGTIEQGIIDEDGIDLNTLGTAYDTITNRRKELEYESCYDDKYTIYFTGYVKLISRLAINRLKELNNEDTLNIIKSANKSEFIPIYLDKRCSIFRIKISFKNELIDNNKKHIRLLCIEIDNKIVWCNTFSNNMLITGTSDFNSVFCNTKHLTGLPLNNSICTNDIKIGDFYTREIDTNYSTLHGMPLPNITEYKKLWELIINYDLIILEVDRNKIIKSVKRYPSSTNINIVAYSLTTNKILELSTNVDIDYPDVKLINLHCRYKNCISKINTLKVKKITTLEEYMNKQLIKDIKEMFMFSHYNTIFKILCTTDKDLNNIKNNKDAYDYSCGLKKEVLELSKELKNINSIDSLNESQIISILESGLCNSKYTTIAEAFKLCNNPSNCKSIIGSNKVLLEWDTVDKCKLYCVTNLNSSTDIPNVYKSRLSLKDMLTTIKCIDTGLVGDELHKITDEPINTDDFHFVLTNCDLANTHRHIKFYVAIQHKTLECFILADIDDIEYYTLFRFKTFLDAEDFLFNYSKEYGEHKEILCELGIALEDIIYKRYNAEENIIMEHRSTISSLRGIILRGTPNNYPVETIHTELLDKLAKQQ